jgi:Xaa-Pro aminopeptidase
MTPTALKRELFQSDFQAAEFTARRTRIFDAIGNEACAILQGAGPVRRSEKFRQTNEFYYLSGVEIPQAYLLLDGRSRKTSIYLQPRNEKQERSEGGGISIDDAAMIAEFSGVDAVLPAAELALALRFATILYTPHSPSEGPAMYRDELLSAEKVIAADSWEARPRRELRFIDRLRANCSSVDIRDLTPVLDGLRLYKSPAEIAVMRRAGHICAQALCEAMCCTRPGVDEYQLGAAAEYIYGVNDALGAAYRPIIATGENIWYPHYSRNNCALKDGEVVLFDCAPDCAYYTSDIGRTWPVNGKFSPLQRELYGFITRYHKELLKRIRPGVLPAQILEETAVEMIGVIAATPFSKPAYEQAARAALKYSGHLSHPVGMCVHDVGKYWDRPMQPGLVFAVDPQMWIPEERLYIRVEDTVVVTEVGFENFTSLAPLELDDIEAMVGKHSKDGNGDPLKRRTSSW